jgi:nucleoside phosphorylase
MPEPGMPETEATVPEGRKDQWQEFTAQVQVLDAWASEGVGLPCRAPRSDYKSTSTYTLLMPPLRGSRGHPATRQVDLSELLSEVSDLLGLEELDAYLFGSRRYKTGSIRSDIDILLFLDGQIAYAQAREIWNLEPYLDIFYGNDNSVRSIVNESVISRSSRTSLVRDLDALPLFIKGEWQTSADNWRVQDVLAKRNPSATAADLYELGTDPPANRADILVVTALPEEYREVAVALGVILRDGRSRVEIAEHDGSPWLIEVTLINSMGSVQAALETLDSLRRTKAPHVVLLGIAAGIPGQVQLGDVVIPEQIYYYEGSKIVDSGELPAPSWKTTDPMVRRFASVFPTISGVANRKDPIRLVTEVVMASGEKVVASDEFRGKLGPAHRKLAAIDMESYGVACAAERRRARLTVIKGISDFADSSKNDDHHALAAQVSAQVFDWLVREGAFSLRSDEDLRNATLRPHNA